MTEQERNIRLNEIQNEITSLYSEINRLYDEKNKLLFGDIEKKYVDKFIKVSTEYKSVDKYMYVYMTDPDNNNNLHLYGHMFIIPVHREDTSDEIYFEYNENGDIALSRHELLTRVSEISEEEYWKIYDEHVKQIRSVAENELNTIRNGIRKN